MDPTNTLVLDLGDVLDPYAGKKINQAKQEAVIKTLALLHCRVMGIGPLDITGEKPFLSQPILPNLPPLVAANLKCHGELEPRIKKYVIININGINIGITGVIPDLSTRSVINPEYQVSNPETALKQVLPELKEKSDFILLLSQFRAKDTETLIKPLKSIDLALCLGPYLVDLGKPSDLRVINVSNRAQQVGIVEIQKNMGKTTIKEATRVQLSPNIPSNPEVDALVDTATEKIKREKQAQRYKMEQEKAKEYLKMTPEEFIKSYNHSTK